VDRTSVLREIVRGAIALSGVAAWAIVVYLLAA
jgi:hypothetical protein